MRKWFCLLTALLFCLLPVGCGEEESKSIRLDFTGQVTNLDPQFVTDETSRTILSNTFDGLLRQTEDGTLEPACAESYTISADGRVYTFILRDDLRWSNGDPVTANDFVFALRRLFHPQVPSPYAGEYLAIEGAAQVLAGQLPQESLGARALDDRTLEITLTQPSALFLQRLAATPALPCEEKFFTETKARYGLSVNALLFNGPYEISSWREEQVVLKKNSRYFAEETVVCPQVVFYSSRVVTAEEAEKPEDVQSARDLFLAGSADLYKASYEELEQLEGAGAQILSVENTVWMLAFRQQGALAEPLVRRSFLQAVDRSGISERLPEQYRFTDSCVPQNNLLEGMDDPTISSGDTQTARETLLQGLSLLELEKMPTVTLLLPESAGLTDLAGYYQRQWMENLIVYVNLERVSDSEYQSRIASGDFDLAFLAMEAEGQGPGGMLESFLSGSSRNVVGYENPDYDALVTGALEEDQMEDTIACYEQAQQMLLDQGVVQPFAAQSTYYALGQRTSGITLEGGLLSFRSASRY